MQDATYIEGVPSHKLWAGECCSESLPKEGAVRG